MEYTAEQYLDRIENKRLNSTPLYKSYLKEMIDFAEKYAKQLILTDVSQHRELLKAYAELIQSDYTTLHFFDDAVEEKYRLTFLSL